MGYYAHIMQTKSESNVARDAGHALSVLRHRVTGAIERGEATAIAGVPSPNEATKGTDTAAKLRAAIDHSKSHDTIAHVTIEGMDMPAVMAEINALYDGDTDYSDTSEKGQYDVWGCSEAKPEDMEFRLTITLV